MAIPSPDSLPGGWPLPALHREINRMFETFGQGLGFKPLALDEADFNPRSEIHKTEATTTIRVELPGVDQKDVEISVTDDTIEISGVKKSETEAKDGDVYRSERSFGSFYRAFALPFTIDAGKVTATFDKGVLAVTIPTPAEPAPKSTRIAIKS